MGLGFDSPFFNRSAGDVVDLMGEVYPELRQAGELIARVTIAEEDRFFRALAAGTRVFEDVVEKVRASGGNCIPGDEAFRLYDTYGLPVELAREFASDVGMQIDEREFEAAMEGQRSRARAAWKGGSEAAAAQTLVAELSEQGIEKTTFTGFVEFAHQSGKIIGLLQENASIEKLECGSAGAMIVDVTPFYGESGGQVGDRGEVCTDNGHATVSDTQRLPGGLVIHSVDVKSGELSIGDKVNLEIDTERRVNTARNHTATHLLHAALRDRLGEHVRQSGSMVTPDHLRFDFSHFEPVDAGQLAELERDVNEVIRADITMEVSEMSHREAIKQGALAFFGDKYGDVVRVVNVPGISRELCGGTHVVRTGEIGPFMIIKEESVAAGTRRIEAITGAAAVESLQKQRSRFRQVTASLKTSEEDAPDSVERLLLRLKEVERGNEDLRLRLASHETSTDLEDYEVEVEGVRLLRREVEGLDAGGLRSLADSMKKEIGSGIIVLGTRNDDGAQIVVGVTADLSKRIKADDIVSSLAKLIGGGGGGKAEMAQAGGPDGSKLSRVFENSTKIIEELLG